MFHLEVASSARNMANYVSHGDGYVKFEWYNINHISLKIILQSDIISTISTQKISYNNNVANESPHSSAA